MNVILLTDKDFIRPPRCVRLADRRYFHIRDILKSSVGDRLCVGKLNGDLGLGQITGFPEAAVDMDVSFSQPAPLPHPATLVLALPRPIVLKRVLAAVASFGVKKIFLIHSWRVEKSFWKSPVLSTEQIQEAFRLGLEQAKDTVMPEILLRKSFKPFVEDELPLLINGVPAFVGHPEARKNLATKPRRDCVLFVGPEGGFINYEMDLLRQAGVIPVSLGQRILRVETAVSALLAKVA